jgi:hypothetical protein
MAQYNITIHAAGPMRKADVSEIQIQTGDTLSITAQAGAATILCLGGGTAALTGSASTIELAAGATVTLTLGAVSPGSYCIVLQAHGWPVPTNIDCGVAASTTLTIRSAAKSDFPGPDDVVVGSAVPPPPDNGS